MNWYAITNRMVDLRFWYMVAKVGKRAAFRAARCPETWKLSAQQSYALK